MFQSLPYVMKICSHPLLVIGEKIPHSLSCLLSELFPANADIISELHKLHHSPKLVALQEILEECGIGVVASSSEGSVNVGQHRVLIFAQNKVIILSSWKIFFLSEFVLFRVICYDNSDIACRLFLT